MSNEKFVLGIDLGTSSIKVMALGRYGTMISESEKVTDLTNLEGYSEEDPNEWYQKTIKAIKALESKDGLCLKNVDAISFSGQMHGLVLLDKNGKLLCNSILWNDTRSFREVEEINERIDSNDLLDITGNKMVEAYLLPKLLWIKKNEPKIWNEIGRILLPKDYLKYKIVGLINTDFSDATGTGLFDIKSRKWSLRLLNEFDIKKEWMPSITESVDVIGHVNEEFYKKTGIPQSAIVTSGAADNAAGAIGAGVYKKNNLLTSIGTSGVVLKPEKSLIKGNGILQLEYSAIKNRYYSMGVTLSAGHSFDWLRKTFFSKKSFNEMTKMANHSKLGAQGMMFAPYISGERTPHFDAKIRGSFTNISDINNENDFVRATMEGITFSLKEIVEIYSEYDDIDEIISIGGGSHSRVWLQMQADIFGVSVKTIKGEQGPSLGAALLAAVAINWFGTIENAIDQTVEYNAEQYMPEEGNSRKYQEIYQDYKKIYQCTKELERI